MQIYDSKAEFTEYWYVSYVTKTLEFILIECFQVHDTLLEY